MKATLRIALETEPIERVEAEVAVASFFESDRPLRGAAGRCDWRLCGMLSGLVAEGRLSGARGDALLVPTFRRLRAPRLLLLGLGAADRFGAPELVAAVSGAVGRLLDLGARSAALAIPGDWIGAVPVRPATEAAARGALEELTRRGASLCLRLLVPPGGGSRALRGLEALASQAPAGALEIADPDAASGAAPRPPHVGSPLPDPVSPAPGRP